MVRRLHESPRLEDNVGRTFPLFLSLFSFEPISPYFLHLLCLNYNATRPDWSWIDLFDLVPILCFFCPISGGVLEYNVACVLTYKLCLCT